MHDPFRFASLGVEAQRAILVGFLRDEPLVMDILTGLRELELPQGWLVAGAIYNLVWNRLSGLPPLKGIKDADIAYFDATDLSYEAEDAVIRRATQQFSGLALPVEVRNQARVHLWFPEKFNQPFPPLQSALEALDRYASKTHAVAARLEADGEISIAAPFGLENIFAFRIVPNRALPNNRATHEAKGRRAQSIWPHVVVEPW